MNDNDIEMINTHQTKNQIRQDKERKKGKFKPSKGAQKLKITDGKRIREEDEDEHVIYPSEDFLIKSQNMVLKGQGMLQLGHRSSTNKRFEATRIIKDGLIDKGMTEAQINEFQDTQDFTAQVEDAVTKITYTGTYYHDEDQKVVSLASKATIYAYSDVLRAIGGTAADLKKVFEALNTESFLQELIQDFTRQGGKLKDTD